MIAANALYGKLSVSSIATIVNVIDDAKVNL